ncbi:MAG TPA: hypothetical protein VGI10_16940 [Polyangiaceae bacterium]
MTAAAENELTQALLALEAVHDEESSALTRLNHQTLEQIVEQKLALSARVMELAARGEPSREERALLMRIRRAAAKNRLLALHARDAVKNILAGAGILPVTSFGSQRAAAVQHGVRVDWRG